MMRRTAGAGGRRWGRGRGVARVGWLWLAAHSIYCSTSSTYELVLARSAPLELGRVRNRKISASGILEDHRVAKPLMRRIYLDRI